MVPMTSSLYVPGVMEDNSNVLVEVGAGYFVEKNSTDATAYCERKIKGLSENSSKVGQLINGKKLQLNKVTEESSQHKTQYGLRSKDQYYICENCNMAASANNMMDHVKVSSLTAGVKVLTKLHFLG